MTISYSSKLLIALLLSFLLITACQNTKTNQPLSIDNQSQNLNTTSSIQDDDWLIPLLSSYLDTENSGDPPQAISMTATPVSGTQPLFVTFSNFEYSYDESVGLKRIRFKSGAGSCTGCEWDLHIPLDTYYTYRYPGTYTASITVEDNNNQQDTFELEINVENIPPVIKSAIFTPPKIPQGIAPITLTLENLHTEGDGLDQMTINFGDNTTYNGPIQEIAHTYTESGEYEGSIIISDIYGGSSEPYPFQVTVLANQNTTPSPPIIQGVDINSESWTTWKRVFFRNFEILSEQEITSMFFELQENATTFSSYNQKTIRIIDGVPESIYFDYPRGIHTYKITAFDSNGLSGSITGSIIARCNNPEPIRGSCQNIY